MFAVPIYLAPCSARRCLALISPTRLFLLPLLQPSEFNEHACHGHDVLASMLLPSFATSLSGVSDRLLRLHVQASTEGGGGGQTAAQRESGVFTPTGPPAPEPVSGLPPMPRIVEKVRSIVASVICQQRPLHWHLMKSGLQIAISIHRCQAVKQRVAKGRGVLRRQVHELCK